MAAKIAATTAYLNKEREQTEGMKRKEMVEERKRTKEEKEKLAEKESSMDDFKRLQARRREAEGKDDPIVRNNMNWFLLKKILKIYY